MAKALCVTIPDLLTGSERNRDEEIRELVEDPLVSEMMSFIHKLNGMQMTSILGQVRDMAIHPRRTA